MYSIEKTKGINVFRQFDYVLFISVLLLSLIGMVVLYSATLSIKDGSGMMVKQGISLTLGITLALIMSIIDYKDFKTLGLIFYIISVMLLVYVLFKGSGRSTWGSQSWINLPGGFNLQPSELAKITFVMCISIFLDRIKDGQDVQKNFIKLAIYAALPIGLVFLQPDVGTGIVFIFVLFGILFVYGIKYRYILISIGALSVVAPIVWFSGLLNESRKNRILEYIFPGSNPQSSSWQIDKAEMAIGSGQIFGSGLTKGDFTQGGMVPVKESDFIFSVIGEELGFVGAVAVIVLIFVILIRCLYIARNSRDYFGSFMVTGLASMLGFHFMQNIGMHLRLMPITGLPLPFVSYGGSAMITNYIAIGIILSVSLRRKRTIFNASQ